MLLRCMEEEGHTKSSDRIANAKIDPSRVQVEDAYRIIIGVPPDNLSSSKVELDILNQPTKNHKPIS